MTGTVKTESKGKGKMSSSTKRLDEIDRKILDILQNDSEMPVSEIADAVNLSATPCWRRIRRLEEIGVIKRRVVLVNRKMINVSMTIFIGVKAPHHDIRWLKAFRDLIDEIPEIVEAYRLTGSTDYIVKVVVPDIETYDAVYKKMISKMNFSEVNSSISMEEIKFTTSMPTHYA
jgi:Lrp/AsnC family transcriptional regulator